MKKFKAFSDVVVGNGFDNDGSTWHGYILSTKQWAQFFFNHWFFKLYYFSMTVLNWGTWVKENSTIIFLVFFHQEVKIDYCLTSSTLSRVKRIGKLCTKSCLSLTLINENVEIVKNLQFIFHIFYYVQLRLCQMLEFACSFLINNFFQNHLIW